MKAKLNFTQQKFLVLSIFLLLLPKSLAMADVDKGLKLREGGVTYSTELNTNPSANASSKFRVRGNDGTTYGVDAVSSSNQYASKTTFRSSGTSYATKKFDSTLLAYWKLDESSGTTAADSTSNGQTILLGNGTCSGGICPSFVTGKYGNGLSFDGVNDYAKVSALNVGTNTNQLTIAFWMKVNNFNNVTSCDEILELSPAVDPGGSGMNSILTGFGIWLSPDDCGGSLINDFEVSIKGDVGYNASCYRVPTSGVWHHYAVVIDKTLGASNELKVYIDATLLTAQLTLISTNNSSNNYFANNMLNMMQRISKAGTNNQGILDEIRIYKHALNQVEITDLYNRVP